MTNKKQIQSLTTQLQAASSGSDERFNALDVLWDLASDTDVQIIIVEEFPSLLLELARVLREDRGPERRYALGVISNLCSPVSNRIKLSSSAVGLLTILLQTIQDENDSNTEAKLNMLTILFNLSSEEAVVKELMKLNAHLAYIKAVRECGPDPRYWEELDKDRYLGQQAVDCLMNLAQWEFTRVILKKCETVEVLTPLARSIYDVSFAATVTISFIIGREEKGISMEIFRQDSLPVQVICDLLSLAYERKRTVGGILFSLSGALNIYYELSLSDNKKQLLATSTNRKVLQQIISHLFPQSIYVPSERRDEIDTMTCDLAVRVLYQLSFVQEDDEELREKSKGFIPENCGMKDMLLYFLSSPQFPRQELSDAWRLLASRLNIKLHTTNTSSSAAAAAAATTNVVKTNATVPNVATTISHSEPSKQSIHPTVTNTENDTKKKKVQQTQEPAVLTTPAITPSTTATAIHTKPQDRKDIVSTPLPTPTTTTTTTTTTPATQTQQQQVVQPVIQQPVVQQQPQFEGDGKHIMISYCWSNAAQPEIVRDFAKELRQSGGYEVWIDTEGSAYVPKMSGSVDDCMASAVEHCYAVIICCSKEYKISNNCRLEANYANVRMKNKQLSKIIFVMMQETYTTVSTPDSVDGYLGIMIGNQLWYPLWNRRVIPSTINEIVNILGDHARRVTTTTTMSAADVGMESMPTTSSSSKQPAAATTTAASAAAVSTTPRTTTVAASTAIPSSNTAILEGFDRLQGFIQGRLNEIEKTLENKIYGLEGRMSRMESTMGEILQHVQKH